MKKLMTGLALGAFAALLVVASPAALAQSERENSTFTVTEPVDVGSFTLQPGTYLIKVVMLESNRNMIQVTNEDQTKVFASVLATPHTLAANEAAPTSRYVYYATAPGQRKALRTWFARDTTNGQDIVYPKQRAMELAVVAKAPVVAIPDDVKETEYKSATLTVVTPQQEVRPYEEPAARRHDRRGTARQAAAGDGVHGPALRRARPPVHRRRRRGARPFEAGQVEPVPP